MADWYEIQINVISEKPKTVRQPKGFKLHETSWNCRNFKVLQRTRWLTVIHVFARGTALTHYPMDSVLALIEQSLIDKEFITYSFLGKANQGFEDYCLSWENNRIARNNSKIKKLKK